MIGEYFIRKGYKFVKQYDKTKMYVKPEEALDGHFIKHDMIDHGHLSLFHRARPWLKNPYKTYFCALGKDCPSLDPLGDGLCPSGQCKPFDSYWDGYSAAFVTGRINGIVVIDIDPRDGQTVKSIIKNIEEKYGPMPKTWSVMTPRKGAHIYYRWNGSFRSGTFPTLPGVEFKGDNSKVNFPPFASEHGVYKWNAIPNDETLADLPQAFVDLASQYRQIKPAQQREIRSNWGSSDERSLVESALASIPIQQAYGPAMGSASGHSLFYSLGYACCSSGHEDAFIDWCHTDQQKDKWVSQAQLRNFRRQGDKKLGYLFWVAETEFGWTRSTR